jgi:predicted outer membrane repeat protein
MVTVSDSTFSDNEAAGGGGINADGTITISGSTFSGNGAGFIGGGIWVRGTVEVRDSVFSGNGAEFVGGGIFLSQGTLIVSNSTTITGNYGGFGGGIANGDPSSPDNAATLFVSDSTITQNDAIVGGGILNAGTLVVSDSSITKNTVTGFDGGGIFNFGPLATIQIKGDTVVANNVPNDIAP